MTTALLTTLLNAGNAWLVKANELVANLTTFEAAYDALATNLRGVYSQESRWLVNVDPDAAEVKGYRGTYKTVADAITDAPDAGYIELVLAAGKTHTIASNITVRGANILFSSSGGANPVLDVTAKLTATHNVLYRLYTFGMSFFEFRDVDVKFPTAALDPGLPWSTSRSLISHATCGPNFIAMENGVVTSTIVGTEFGLVDGAGGSSSNIGLRSTTFDGVSSHALVSGDAGSAIISRFSVTLTNGAALHDGGTVGTNILLN